MPLVTYRCGRVWYILQMHRCYLHAPSNMQVWYSMVHISDTGILLSMPLATYRYYTVWYIFQMQRYSLHATSNIGMIECSIYFKCKDTTFTSLATYRSDRAWYLFQMYLDAISILQVWQEYDTYFRCKSSWSSSECILWSKSTTVRLCSTTSLLCKYSILISELLFQPPSFILQCCNSSTGLFRDITYFFFYVICNFLIVFEVLFLAVLRWHVESKLVLYFEILSIFFNSSKIAQVHNPLHCAFFSSFGCGKVT